VSEERERRWLPPQAPGGAEPPRYGPPEPPPVPVAAPAPTYAPPSGAAPRYAPPPAAPPPAEAGARTPPPFLAPGPPGTGAAIASLITGVAGLVLFVLSGFGLVFILNLPASIMAWVLGIQGRRKVDRGETDQHRGLAQAGLVLGIVGTAMGVLAIIGWVIAITTSEELRDELRKQLEEASKGDQFLHGALYATWVVVRLVA
jgi:hypothetical protein